MNNLDEELIEKRVRTFTKMVQSAKLTAMNGQHSFEEWYEAAKAHYGTELKSQEAEAIKILFFENGFGV